MASDQDWIDITTLADRYEIQMSRFTSMKRWRRKASLRAVDSEYNLYMVSDEEYPWNYSEVPND